MPDAANRTAFSDIRVGLILAKSQLAKGFVVYKAFLIALYPRCMTRQDKT